MVDDAKEEKKEKKFFENTKSGAEKMLKDHKRFAAGGVTNDQRFKLGRNLARVANQKKSGRGK